MNAGFSEDTVEQATLAWFEALDYEVLHGLDIAPGERGAGQLRGGRSLRSSGASRRATQS